ncbi:MAG: glucose-6-phosphate isomerase, partial [Woeseiaceae bacterium]
MSFIERKLPARYPTDLPAWKKLQRHYRESMRDKTLRELFLRDNQRTERCAVEAGDLTLDFSKTHVAASTRKLLVALAKEAQVLDAIAAMFAGERINETEDRAVLHVALRAKMSDKVALETGGVTEIREVLNAMESFVEGVHAGEIRGRTGKRLANIVNIGIGGSDLGPVMASRALRPYWTGGMRFYGVSNVDGTQLADLADVLDAESTLFVICSKTFTTLETMTNANAAREWIAERLGQ